MLTDRDDLIDSEGAVIRRKHHSQIKDRTQTPG